MLEIMTWNTALTEDTTNREVIIKYIKEFLNRPNSIAVLQQIPLKDPDMGWGLHSVYQALLANFPSTDYSIFQNDRYNNGSIYMLTVVITKMEHVAPADARYYPNGVMTNRECAISVCTDKVQELTILGIHAKSGSRNADYLRAIREAPDIILGDFNAGDYLESENRKIFKTILKDHVCICNLPTKRVLDRNQELIRKGCIDHVFVKREYVACCSSLIVHENVAYSDHYPITFKIDV